MIEVTRLNGAIYYLNPDMIVTLESTPDTVITLASGEKLLVLESPDTLIERFIALKRRIVCGLPLVRSDEGS